MKLSLKDLFAAMSFCAVLAAIFAYIGKPNLFVMEHFVLAIVMALVFLWMACGDQRRKYAIIVPAPFFLCIFGESIGIVLQAFLLIMAGCVNACVTPRWSIVRMTWITSICFLAGIVANLLPGWAADARMKAGRMKFPFESLESRLAYESRRIDSKKDPPKTFSTEVEAELNAIENDADLRGGREWRLLAIHGLEYERFVRSEGFGIGRSGGIPSEPLDILPLTDVKFAETTPRGRYYLPSEFDFRSKRAYGREENLHALARFDFLNPASLGAVLEPVTKVAGFVEHGFRDSPNRGLPQPFSLLIDRLELVSLLKFDEPRVYVLDHLPRMDQLSHDNVPTRPLNEFESISLQKLWVDEDVIFKARPQGFQMLGSLRATNDCLKCHEVQRGTLLGAFSYEISEK